ncbi:MAG TPA: mevalonate kinase [Anaerolineales bacterium]|nr:mevalonate kinase [Anaerolineales bacterium]
MSTATAPGKIILFGEHAVVYGQPAIAVPVAQVRAEALAEPWPGGAAGTGQILAPNVGLDTTLDQLSTDHPLAAALCGVQTMLGVGQFPPFRLTIRSTIPVAGGMGSGAAVSVAVIRAMSVFLGQPLLDEQVNALAYEVEKLHHGTPSGIDNTVITYARPVYFVRSQPIETFEVPTPFTIIIADTGVASSTAITVGDVRKAWQADPERYNKIFQWVGNLVMKARRAIEAGTPETLGPLMDENHTQLQKMGVSSPELDHLVDVARGAGALGAKLSGGGRGGNMIALVEKEKASQIANVLRKAGAVRTVVTEIGGLP